MPGKKVVIVIVEGPTDEDALGTIFERFFDKSTVRVKVIHGDITTEKQVNVSNVLNQITAIIKQCLDEYKLHKADLLRVIHIVDTDGAYVPDTAIILDDQAEKPFYSTSHIKTSNPEGIIQRNQTKKANLTKLRKARFIWNDIPYSVFYMSCNLDHALYNKLNLSDDEKERYALQFAKRYRNDLPSFVEYVQDSDFSVVDGYVTSWEYIEQELHSLERHTNIGLCFNSEMLSDT